MYIDFELELTGSFNDKLLKFLIICNIAKERKFILIEPYFSWNRLYLFSDIYDLEYFNTMLKGLINTRCLVISRDVFSKLSNYKKTSFKKLLYSNNIYSDIDIYKIYDNYPFIIKCLKSLKLLDKLHSQIKLENSYNYLYLLDIRFVEYTNTIINLINSLFDKKDTYTNDNDNYGFITLITNFNKLDKIKNDTFLSEILDFHFRLFSDSYISMETSNIDLCRLKRDINCNFEKYQNYLLKIKNNNIILFNDISHIIK